MTSNRAAFKKCLLSLLDGSTGLIPSNELAWDVSLDVDWSCWFKRLLQFDYEMAHISMFRHYTATHPGLPHPQGYICKKRPPTKSNVVDWGEGIKCLALWWFHVDWSCSLSAFIVCFLYGDKLARISMFRHYTANPPGNATPSVLYLWKAAPYNFDCSFGERE